MRLKEQERSIALIRRRQRGFGLGLTLVLAFACSAETDRGPEVQAKRQAAAADEVLINEVYVNAPGGGDDGVEYIELRGTPGASLADVHLLIIDGDANAAGEVDDSIDFSTACGGAACSLGANGLLLLAAPGAYTPPAETTLVAILPTGDSVLENNSISLLLVKSAAPIAEDTDLDVNDDGVIDQPSGITVLDSVGWTDGDTAQDFVYGAHLTRVAGATPDAATRIGDGTASATAWLYGDLQSGLEYDPATLNAPVPGGPVLTLTPGDDNFTDPSGAGGAGGGAGAPGIAGAAGSGGPVTGGAGGGAGAAGAGPGDAGAGGLAGSPGTAGAGGAAGGPGTGGMGGSAGTATAGAGGIGDAGSAGAGDAGSAGAGDAGSAGAGDAGSAGAATGGTGGSSTGGSSTGGTGGSTTGGTGGFTGGTGGTGTGGRQILTSEDDGCGCRTAGSDTRAPRGWALFGVAAALGAWRRRRSR